MKLKKSLDMVLKIKFIISYLREIYTYIYMQKGIGVLLKSGVTFEKHIPRLVARFH